MNRSFWIKNKLPDFFYEKNGSPECSHAGLIFYQSAMPIVLSAQQRQLSAISYRLFLTKSRCNCHQHQARLEERAWFGFRTLLVLSVLLPLPSPDPQIISTQMGKVVRQYRQHYHVKGLGACMYRGGSKYNANCQETKKGSKRFICKEGRLCFAHLGLISLCPDLYKAYLGPGSLGTLTMHPFILLYFAMKWIRKLAWMF